MQPMPDNLQEIRERLKRERRLSIERRLSKRGLQDGQKNRRGRGGERRRLEGSLIRADGVSLVDDDMIVSEVSISERLPLPSDIAEETTDVRF